MNLTLGFVFMILGAICGGSFGLPSKYAKKDTPWEALWGPFFFFVTILLPTLLGPIIVKDFFGVFAKAEPVKLIAPLIFGLLWGLGSMTLGMSFAFIGLSLAYALNYGAQIVTGWLVPTLVRSPETFATTHGLVILAGVVTCVLGVIACGRAAMLKERSLADGSAGEAEQETGTKKPKMLIGVAIGVASGVLCACYAVSGSFAKDVVTKVASGMGNAPWRAAWAEMSIIVWGGAISACTYCIVQLTRNKTWGHVAKPGVGKLLLLAGAMAVLHDAAIFLFGLGHFHMGEKLGIPVGYPIFMSFAIIVGNFHGFRTGEWKGASRQSVGWIAAGIAILIVGVCLLSAGSYISLG